ncbi:hypothetical protein COX86_02630 [Candidatus Micrarchaeota archaeon CG_4_10_14_0_2_um_filter_60_11]|nr:MAG: hypothetical protein AUJ16_00435 [Candidatus Micrarchaeota archaeon CG1_02_60_51]PIN96257.1 MAG: hypothetical protein COU39_02030 [Candidatus Micrarchaeota archaeon CG10_big_fil_rev_8_21_14_0_10_60_32]PIO02158.1 MAG: hypothetical protein COT58_01500 [Candidatus Micrarchaeota archaeon CG09_land_8_20_14_0_10_60_16]PIY91367.1 MAG: hypothetical protein COY71_03540 [Candidatus Micrarchaeota archaeon CG_4_10_14_0_8_um_filter_60_7]PIZ90904.1 MAG: hypothetical protein COX86_02630 [Candidatus Mi
MLGRQHLLLSLSTAAALALPLYYGGLLALLPLALLLAGVFIGSLAPDADAEDAAVFHKAKAPFLRRFTRVFGWILPLFGYALKWLVYKPLALVFGGDGHRGLMHSLSGLLASSVLIGIYVAIVTVAFHFFDWLGLAVFVAGFAFGFLLHLLEDACTVSGVDFGYPFRSLRFYGNARTGEGFKVDLFVLLFALLAAGVWFGFSMVSWGLWLKEAVVFCGMALAWLLLFSACGVRRK